MLQIFSWRKSYFEDSTNFSLNLSNLFRYKTHDNVNLNKTLHSKTYETVSMWVWIDCQHSYLYHKTKRKKKRVKIIQFLKASKEYLMWAPRGYSPLRFVSFSSFWCLLIVFRHRFFVSIITDTTREKKSKAAKPSSYLLCLLYKFTSFYWIFSVFFHTRAKKFFHVIHVESIWM